MISVLKIVIWEGTCKFIGFMVRNPLWIYKIAYLYHGYLFYVADQYCLLFFFAANYAPGLSMFSPRGGAPGN